jgi:hypothetical protein
MVLLPIEVITQGISQAAGGEAGLLGIIAGAIADALIGKEAFTFPKFTPPGVGTVAKAFIKVDKERIKALAKGCEHCKMVDGAAKVVEEVTGLCVDKTDDGKVCFTQAEWDEKWVNGQTVIKGFAADMGDVGGSILSSSSRSCSCASRSTASCASSTTWCCPRAAWRTRPARRRAC